MLLFRIQLATTLALLATTALANSPYAINNFSTDMVFAAALVQARTLGGNCQITPATQVSGIRAQCDYAPCSSRDKDGACDVQDESTKGLTIASQPILRITLEAPVDSATLSRIMFIFDGQHEAVKASLYQTYDPPGDDVKPADQQGWSRARRVRWTQGPYHLGLSDIPKLVTLEADQVQK